ncbi:hypothetical protein K435DRAFT_683581 [Dendrothele bispora CBS 962.96]|uniref:DUF6534 domain-containing protein n=1 Tax=Dendrothele bispora (strain CBS 962.96) TaxID=1314807 RepID=A0A4S8LC83_DENBC|nr:hypothetical protein K435DRAFT_683581 [Dendrothele bispora CBS 962.96]
MFYDQLEIGWNCSLAAVSDIIASVSLLWAFSSLKNGIKQTDTLLQKIFQYTVTRGLFVTIDQTTLVIIFLIKPETLWWTPFHFSLSKVYVITMSKCLIELFFLPLINGVCHKLQLQCLMAHKML